MSSFKLVVGAQKLCKFRRYTVTLTVPKSWRVESGLTEEKVMKAQRIILTEVFLTENLHLE